MDFQLGIHILRSIAAIIANLYTGEKLLLFVNLGLANVSLNSSLDLSYSVENGSSERSLRGTFSGSLIARDQF